MASKVRTIKAVETMGKIIDKLKSCDEAQVCEIAAHLDVANSTVYNHLATLEKIGLVTREDDVYKLSPRFIHYSSIVRRENPIYDKSEAISTRIAQNTGEQAFFIVPDTGRGLVLSKADGENAVPIGPEVGDFVYLHDTAAGQAILAEQSEDEVTACLSEHGLPKQASETITDMDAFLDRLETVRENGYAITRDERVDGLTAIGIAVQTEDRIVGAVTVAGAQHRLQKNQTQYIEELQNAVVELTISLPQQNGEETSDNTGMIK